MLLIYYSLANISKSICDDLPLTRLGSIPECELGELDLPRLPPPWIDRPVMLNLYPNRLTLGVSIVEYCEVRASMQLKRLRAWKSYPVVKS